MRYTRRTWREEVALSTGRGGEARELRRARVLVTVRSCGGGGGGSQKFNLPAGTDGARHDGERIVSCRRESKNRAVGLTVCGRGATAARDTGRAAALRTSATATRAAFAPIASACTGLSGGHGVGQRRAAGKRRSAPPTIPVSADLADRSTLVYVRGPIERCKCSACGQRELSLHSRRRRATKEDRPFGERIWIPSIRLDPPVGQRAWLYVGRGAAESGRRYPIADDGDDRRADGEMHHRLVGLEKRRSACQARTSSPHFRAKSRSSLRPGDGLFPPPTRPGTVRRDRRERPTQQDAELLRRPARDVPVSFSSVPPSDRPPFFAIGANDRRALYPRR